VREGQLLAGLSAPLESFPVNPRGFAINAAGDVLTQAVLASGTTAVLLNDTVLAQPGDPSPVFGVKLGHIYDTVALGDGGDTAYFSLYGGGRGLLWNGVEVAHVGQSVPAFAPSLLESFGNRPVDIDADGRIVWFADWDDPDATRDTGFVRDHELILQEGVSLAGGQVIDEFSYEMDLSSDGRYLAFIASLVGGGQGAFLLDLSSAITPFQGCNPNPAVLEVTGAPTPGASLSILMKKAQGDGVAAFVAISTALAAGSPPCGILVPGIGELLVDAPVLLYALGPWIPALGLSYGSLVIPDQLPLLGIQVYMQGVFVDVGGLTPGEPLRLTDGVSVKLGL